MKQETTRSCPLCRSTSYYIVPSYYTFMIKTGDEPSGKLTALRSDLEEIRAEVHRSLKEAKDDLVKRHLGALKKRVCRYYEDNGECPHGNSCHFLHSNPEGDEVLEMKPRFLLTAEQTVVTGTSGVDQLASLADYLDKGKRNQV